MIDDAELREWFCREVLPLEGTLTRFIRRNCARTDDVMDIRQEVYAATLKGAHAGLPDRPSAYVFTIARNNLINRSRRERIVSFELVADLESLNTPAEAVDLDRQLLARDDLRRAFEGIKRLPSRCGEIVRLRKVEGFTTRETAEQLGVTTHTVERQLTLGMRALTDFMLGGTGKVRRETRGASGRERRES